MSRPLKSPRDRTSKPQCRFEVESVTQLRRFTSQAERYGYRNFKAFAHAVFTAITNGDPAHGVRFEHRYPSGRSKAA